MNVVAVKAADALGAVPADFPFVERFLVARFAHIRSDGDRHFIFTGMAFAERAVAGFARHAGMGEVFGVFNVAGRVAGQTFGLFPETVPGFFKFFIGKSFGVKRGFPLGVNFFVTGAARVGSGVILRKGE